MSDPDAVARRIAALRHLLRMDPANALRYEADIAALGGTDDPGPETPPGPSAPPAPTGKPVLPPFPTEVTPLTERPVRQGVAGGGTPPIRTKRRTTAKARAAVRDATPPEVSPTGGPERREIPLRPERPETPARPDLIAELLERFGELKPIEPFVRKPRPEILPVGIVGSPAGAGKSLAMFRWLKNQYDAGTLHHIVSCPSIDLIKEHEAGLLAAGIPASAIIVVTSERPVGGRSKRTIRVQLRQVFTRLHNTTAHPMVVLCTHDAMRKERPTETTWVPDPTTGEFVEVRIWDHDHWTLFWDEAPDMVEFGHFVLPERHGFLTPLIQATRLGNGLVQLEPTKTLPAHYSGRRSAEERLQHIARNYSGDGVNAVVQSLAEAVGNANRLVLAPEAQWEDLITPDMVDGELRKKPLGGVLDVMMITHPLAYGAYKQVVMLGARIESSLAMILWQALFKIKLEPHPIAERLPATHTTRRLVVHYVFEERASRSFLAQRGESGDTLFNEMAACVAREIVMHDEQPLWNAPIAGADAVHGVRNAFFAPVAKRHKVTPRKSKGVPFTPAMRLPGRASGLNRYLDRHLVALLSVLRFNPAQHAMLQALGLTDAQIDRAFQFNSNYQDALRSNIRVQDGREVQFVDAAGKRRTVRGEGPVHVWLPDKASADDLVTSFPALGGKVVQVKNPPTAKPRKRPVGGAGDASTRGKALRARRAIAKEAAELHRTAWEEEGEDA